MKWITPVLMLIILMGCTSKKENHSTRHQVKSGDPHAGHDMSKASGKLMVMTEPPEVIASQPATLRLMVHDADGAVVKDFETVHEKRVHLIIVREGLDQFDHIHPEIDSGGNITATFTFPAGGTYRLYVDHKPMGKDQATLTGEVRVSGDSPQAAELKPNAPGKVTGDGLNADVSIQNAKVGKETKIAFNLMDSSQKQVGDLQPYLGAMGHLVILSADGKQYVHAHTAENKVVNDQIAFEAHFLKPGIYKAWGQFQRQNKIHIVPFVFKVD